MSSPCLRFSLVSFLLLMPSMLSADDTKPTDPSQAAAVSGSSSSSNGSSTTASTTASPPKYASYLKDAKRHEGLLTVHQKGAKLYGEFNSAAYGSEYIVLISIARGVGSVIPGGFSWGFGDDWVWQFRKIDDRVHIIRKNVRFKAKKGSPEATAVSHAYADSVLFSLPIITKGPKGGDLVDLSSVFMSDLPQISRVLRGFAFSASKSSWASVKAFKDNVELEVAATYASSGSMQLDEVADSRGVTINVHYSISKIPTTGYTPRLADDRIGYFITVLKDYSKKSDRDNFVRYINRWKLDKADSGEAVSPPKEPIIFWIEKTVPYKYRPAIRAGIEEWNKAFLKAGFVDAIEVRQQPDDADWDPEDVNYNTFRWITSSAGFAMGPSRVNPYTGQILDADIIFDADFLRFWKQEFETLTPESIAAMTGGDPLKERLSREKGSLIGATHDLTNACRLNAGMASQFAFGAAAISAADPKAAAQMQEKMIMQGLKEVAMHEVGHTLGLRHNFKASRMLSLKDMNDPEKTKDGMVASVMDYSPANIVPKGWKQGDFFTRTVGPYDVWAIEYGYKEIAGSTDSERESLNKIATRSGEPELQFATDEDTRSTEPDPDTNRFDLGKDALEYARQRSELVRESIPGIVDRMTKDGDDFTQPRRAFNILLSQYGQAMYFASRYVGGLHASRSHKGDKDARLPITIVDAKTQRETLTLLENEVFNDKPFQFPPELYNHLASSNWRHWGSSNSLRKDYPVHGVILMWQERILGQLLAPDTLERIHDSELKVAEKDDALTVAELFERLTRAVFAEVDAVKPGDYSNRKPAISSIRRNLQRSFLSELSRLAMGRGYGVPEDCETVAYFELSELQARIENRLGEKNLKLDTYTLAHLQETATRISKVLDARFTLSNP